MASHSLSLAFLTLVLFAGSARLEEVDEQSCTSRESCLFFPEDFTFGVGTSAYQIEGGWNEDGKGPNVWDTLVHKHPELIKDKSSGDVGPDSYHLYAEDVKKLKELGVDFYRFSISWARILPDGDISSLNPAGVKYYSDLIDLLLQEGIEPMITMFHYDLPQYLEDMGGIANPIFVKYFREYARVLFDNYADRVKVWATFNQPLATAYHGYGVGASAPLKKLHGVGEYLAAYHILMAHAEAYHLYRENYYEKFKGKVGITLIALGMLQRSPGKDLVDRGMEFQLGFFANPIYSKEGGWPEVMQETVDRNSEQEGRAWSRLPAFTPEEVTRIRGSADFMGINYYTGFYMEPGASETVLGSPNAPSLNPSWERDMNLSFTVDPTWKRSHAGWIFLVPEGLRDVLHWVRDKYDNPEVFINENGWSDSGELEDEGRVESLKEHLRVIVETIQEGCRITSYAHWSLLDNFEWTHGYTEKFGLYQVDMEDPEKKRIEKKSARIYRKIIKDRQIY